MKLDKTDQWNRTEHPETDPHVSVDTDFPVKVRTKFNGEKSIFNK